MAKSATGNRLLKVRDGTQYDGQVVREVGAYDCLLLVELTDNDLYVLTPGEFEVVREREEPKNPTFVCPNCRTTIWDGYPFNSAMETRCCGVSKEWLMSVAAAAFGGQVVPRAPVPRTWADPNELPPLEQMQYFQQQQQLGRRGHVIGELAVQKPRANVVVESLTFSRAEVDDLFKEVSRELRPTPRPSNGETIKK